MVRRVKPIKPVTPEKVDAFHQWKSGPSPSNLPVIGLPMRAATARATNGKPILIPISPTLRANPACTAGSSETWRENKYETSAIAGDSGPKVEGRNERILTVCSGEESKDDRKTDDTRCIAASKKDPVEDRCDEDAR